MVLGMSRCLAQGRAPVCVTCCRGASHAWDSKERTPLHHVMKAMTLPLCLRLSTMCLLISIVLRSLQHTGG